MLMFYVHFGNTESKQMPSDKKISSFSSEETLNILKKLIK